MGHGAAQRDRALPEPAYTTFWAAVGEPHALAQDLIVKRAAQVIHTPDADTFFNGLAERVAALEEIDRPHPLTAQMATAMLKRHLAEDRHRIRLQDLVVGEVSAVSERLRGDEFPLPGKGADEEFLRRVGAYEAATEILRGLVATGSYWSRPETDRLWIESVRHVASTRRVSSGVVVWIELQSYPAMLTLYSAGLGAVAAGNFRLLDRLLMQPIVGGPERKIAAACLLPATLKISQGTWKCLPNLDRAHTPLSDHLLDLLASDLAGLIPNCSELDELFDRFELLGGLVYMHNASGTEDPHPQRCWLPAGRFTWRLQSSYLARGLTAWLEDADQQKEDWPPLREGMFGGSYERFAVLKAGFDGFMQRIGPQFI